MARFCIGFDEKHIPPGAAPEECYRAYLFGERDGIVKDAAWAETPFHQEPPACQDHRLSRWLAQAL